MAYMENLCPSDAVKYRQWSVLMFLTRLHSGIPFTLWSFFHCITQFVLNYATNSTSLTVPDFMGWGL